MAPHAPTREGTATRRIAFALSLAVACVGCSAGGLRPGVRGDTNPRLDDRAYHAALEQVTRYDSCYDGFDSRAHFAVTYQSEAFREARAIATARMQGMTRADEEAAIAREREEGAATIEFLVSLYTPILEWNEMGTPRSIWAIGIPRVDAAPVPPSSIERIARPDANLRALYPYVTPFNATYRLRFPRVDADGLAVPGPDTPELVLQIASSLCTITPSWESR